MNSLPDLPKLTSPSSNSAPPLKALREIFANDEKMRVTQDRNGIIRMIETDVPQDVLRVKIAHISFDDESKKGNPMWFPGNVLRFITHAPEVEAFMNAHDIERLLVFINGAASSGWPSVSGELNNVTLSEALDYMLKTVPGLWVFENCSGKAKKKRALFFAFYPTGQ